jgi:hypothetical protein
MPQLDQVLVRSAHRSSKLWSIPCFFRHFAAWAISSRACPQAQCSFFSGHRMAANVVPQQRHFVWLAGYPASSLYVRAGKGCQRTHFRWTPPAWFEELCRQAGVDSQTGNAIQEYPLSARIHTLVEVKQGALWDELAIWEREGVLMHRFPSIRHSTRPGTHSSPNSAVTLSRPTSPPPRPHLNLKASRFTHDTRKSTFKHKSRNDIRT